MTDESVQSQTQSEPQKNSLMIFGAVAVALIAVLAVGTFTMKPKTDMTAPSATPTASTMTAVSSPSPLASSMIAPEGKKQGYVDGVYDVQGTYASPAGPETIAVKIKIAKNVVTEAEVTPEATHPISLKKQTEFSGGFKELVIGKDINEIVLDKVAGASLTTKGFNDALEKVKVEAKS